MRVEERRTCGSHYPDNTGTTPEPGVYKQVTPGGALVPKLTVLRY